MRRVTSIVSCSLKAAGRAAVGIVEQDADLGVVARRPLAGAGEDHVVHARAAHGLERAFAHHPAQGLDEIGLAAAVRADDAGEARLDLELRGVAEALEAGEAQALEFHPKPCAAAGAPPARQGLARPTGEARERRPPRGASGNGSSSSSGHNGRAQSSRKDKKMCETLIWAPRRGSRRIYRANARLRGAGRRRRRSASS